MTDDLDYTLSCLRRSVEEGFAWTLYPAGAAALLAEVERLRGERAAVVAFLRDEYDTHSVQDAADCIENGEHRREEKP